MSFAGWALAALAAFVANTAWFALARARPVGRFKVTRDDGVLFDFATSTGTFSINPRAQVLTYTRGGQRGSLKFSDIKGLAYRFDADYALLEEMFFGFNLADMLPRYHDTIDWFAIAAVTHDGRRIPLFLSGRYQQREFLLGWYIELQEWLLERLGLLKDVEAQSRTALDAIGAHTGSPPLL
ncbi:hypothetical protein LZ009_14435 [Ramlibacter sp. XY19]|uniref:hypothetical protein n=1 Tax=Ramlibacter paludis TaxID=2908000 RepID=UPI0023DB9004|nr:hypothetical protein [Ramlibacter paludis]MCG2593976.1 hypothetical protein [Ramlibacter paludis]